MSETEKAIENLNTAKLILCNPQMLTPEMCIRIGQAITDAIVLLKEQEAIEPRNTYSTTPSGKVIPHIFCGKCNKEIYAIYAFCPFCGKVVRWE